MGGMTQYRKRPGTEVVAVQLDLDTAGFEYEKWGGTQHCKRGDWIVDDGEESYTIDAESFARTYAAGERGCYRETSTVGARRAEGAGSGATKEGTTDYQRGDYLVCNESNGDDCYAVSGEKFEATYEPVE